MIEQAKRLKIVELSARGVGAAGIAADVGVSRRTVYRILELYERTGGLVHAPIPGRPRVTTPQEDRSLVQAAANSTHTLNNLRRQMDFSIIRPSISTVYRRVRVGGLYSGTQQRKDARLEDYGIQNERYGWACETLCEWTAFSKFSRVYVDESSVNSCTAFRQREWRRRGVRTGRGFQFVRSCGWTSVPVFGGLCYDELLPLHFISGRFNAEDYVRVLQDVYLPILRQKFETRPFILQQDNAPTHAARAVKEFVSGIPELERAWVYQPAYSPDLNPIEHVWSRLKRMLSEKNLPNSESLAAATQQAWTTINADKEFLRGLTASMPDRLQAVIDASGGPTSY